MTFTCRQCGCTYSATSAKYRGYCSNRCLAVKAATLGFSRVVWERLRASQGVCSAFESSDYAILLRNGAIGSFRCGKLVLDESAEPAPAGDGQIN